MVAMARAQSAPLLTSSFSLTSHDILGKTPAISGTCFQSGWISCVPNNESVLSKASDLVLTSRKGFDSIN